MLWFGPSLVIISAGFDAHDDDPLADMELTEEDYYWATEACLLACRCCSSIKTNSGSQIKQQEDCGENSASVKVINAEVKCLSILEGGYHLQAISKSSVAHVDALFKSPFSYAMGDYPVEEIAEQSVAKEPTAATPTATAIAREDPETEKETESEAVAAADATSDQAPLSLEDILKGLDSSISSLLMEALMTIPDPEGAGEGGEDEGEEEGDESEEEDQQKEKGEEQEQEES
jgi:hypothetical protein